jgi:molybdate transport system ATP-binding protein
MHLQCRIPLAHFVLDLDVFFDARVTAVYGPSGSGKTTLLDAIAGLRTIPAGEIDIGGKTLFSSARRINLPPRQRSIGYVPQEGALFPHLSVRSNILFGAERTSIAARPDGIELEHVLDILEIGNLVDRPVTQLSGGEAQRIALARAILSKPQLLLLDEPLAALDVALKERILPYLGRVRDEFGIPMIYVTHNLTEVLTLADWVLMIRLGKLVAQGIPKEALRSFRTIAQLGEERYENVFTAQLVESDARGGRTRIRLSSGTDLFIPYLSQPANRTLQIGVSADDILVATERPVGISAGNVLDGMVGQIEMVDGDAILTVLAGEEFLVRITAAAVTRLGLAENKAVFLIIKTRSFRML